MSEHTPGPWEWKYGGLYSQARERDVLRIVGAGYGDEHIECDEADKALIVAAPDLLEALEAMRENYYDIDSRSLALADAAIAKATT